MAILKQPSLSERAEAYIEALGVQGVVSGVSQLLKDMVDTLASRKVEPPDQHVCESCEDCLHDGHKCCGCYDGVCCRKAEAPADERDVLVAVRESLIANGGRADAAVLAALEKLIADSFRKVEVTDDMVEAKPRIIEGHDKFELVPMSYGNREYPPEESGMICSECGWLVGGRNAHPDAETQHRQHVADQYEGVRVPPPTRLFVDALGYVWQDGAAPGFLSMARTTDRNIASPGLIEYRPVALSAALGGGE